MSSTGVISKVISPTTVLGERNRQLNGTIDAMPSSHEAIKTVYGIIIELHPDKVRYFKASTEDQTPICNNNYILLKHSAQEIAERWGTIRVGMKVKVVYAGATGNSGDGEIIGSEETSMTDPIIDNISERGLYFIFTPGSSI